MTFVAHGLMTVYLSKLITKRKSLLIMAFLVGSAPDVLPWITYQLGLTDRWSLYSWIHQFESWIVHIIPGVNLHCWIDYLCHNSKGKWNTTAYVLEILFWLTTIIVISKSHISKKKKT